jgi:hypothetical protein
MTDTETKIPQIAEIEAADNDNRKKSITSKLLLIGGIQVLLLFLGFIVKGSALAFFGG